MGKEGLCPRGLYTYDRDEKRSTRLHKTAAWLAIASLFSTLGIAQSPAASDATTVEARVIALPLPEDRGAGALEQNLKRLKTWASVMMIVAHPDDEDGSMLAYESRGQGVRTSLMTLTRGEGGQNAMSADSYDALGIIRTNELLRADEFYGVRQYWGTEADFGFSKTQEEAFARWGHERVLCDTVLAVRQERPLVLVSSFVGGITDGHGQHQVSGEVNQEAFIAAGDAKVCPEQIAAGLQPWSPRKVYARVPFAPVTEKGMFDYATGKWAPVKFFNYVSKESMTTEPKPDVSIPAGELDAVLGRSYAQIAREGWGEQKSQNGGANPGLSGGEGAEYHLYGSRLLVKPESGSKGDDSNFFDGIPTGLEGLASLLAEPAPAWLTSGLKRISADVARAQQDYRADHPVGIAPQLKQGFVDTKDLRDRVAGGGFVEPGRTDLVAELDLKLGQFETALGESLGLDLQAFTSRGTGGGGFGPFGGGVEETPRSVAPGQAIQVTIHTGDGFGEARLKRVWLTSGDGKPWAAEVPAKLGSDVILKATVPADILPTQPFFTRPSLEQPYYDVTSPMTRDASFVPYPLQAWAEFTYDGLPVRVGEVVQTMQRVMGPGGIFQPLVVTPPVGVRVEPEARILPLDGSPLPVKVTVHTEGKAQGVVRLSLPNGWTASPAEMTFNRTQGGDSEPIVFSVKPAKDGEDAAYSLKAQAESGGRTYSSGWRTIGYQGLRPYNQYEQAVLKTRAVDVKVAQGLRIGYVMGTGDSVPEAIEELTGHAPHLLSAGELASGDLSAYNVILIGIRAYSNRPELAAAQPRLNAFVENGGTLIVQYQSANFPAPFPLTMGRSPERVVEEDAAVKLIAPDDALLMRPNRITSHDFDGWVEERGHSFLESWDKAYTPLTETADAGQDPQRGGLLVAHSGKGTYVYAAYALYRQLPELVPGAYRILANLLSSGAAK